MGEGREGDWECGSCRNRNYAFRSFCNRCKQPRLLVDKKTPADSKWLPRIGDWICTGCSNNNYASREMCKKCGQPKEENEMPAIRMTGAPVPSYSHYFSRMQGLLASKMNFGIAGNSTFQRWMPGNSEFQQSLPTMSGWPYMIVPGNSSGDISYTVSSDQLPGTPKGWRNGDWICNCGFHNYSSRSQCKRCNEPLPTNGMHSSTVNSAVANLYRGTKRLASEEFVNDWDKKRLNAGDISIPFLVSEPQQIYLDMEKLPGPSGGQVHELYSKFTHTNLSKVGTQFSAMPTLFGKGAKQWRVGDWMCQKCDNHNYASRSYCNSAFGADCRPRGFHPRRATLTAVPAAQKKSVRMPYLPGGSKVRGSKRCSSKVRGSKRCSSKVRGERRSMSCQANGGPAKRRGDAARRCRPADDDGSVPPNAA